MSVVALGTSVNNGFSLISVDAEDEEEDVDAQYRSNSGVPNLAPLESSNMSTALSNDDDDDEDNEDDANVGGTKITSVSVHENDGDDEEDDLESPSVRGLTVRSLLSSFFLFFVVVVVNIEYPKNEIGYARES